MTVSIAFITHDFSANSNPLLPGGCAYYRQFLPMLTLQCPKQMGYPAWTAEDGFGINAGGNRAAFGFNVVVMKLMMARNTVIQMKAAQANGQKLVVDVDDWYEDLPESNQAHRVTDPTTNKVINRDHYKNVIMQADRVTVSTEFLFNKYSEMRDNVFHVPNTLDLSVFSSRSVMNRKPIVGWVGGIPWRGGDIELLRAWLPDFLEEHDLMFHHSGHMPEHQSFADLAGIDPRRVTTSKMLPLNQYFVESFCMDIGIVPLNDIPFNHAKSCLKGLEYVGAGIPFVADALPEYRALNSHGVGRVASSPEEWRAEMTRLLDYKTRKKDAAINRAQVKKHYTIGTVTDKWKDALTVW